MLRSWARRDNFRVGGENEINFDWDFELISISDYRVLYHNNEGVIKVTSTS